MADKRDVLAEVFVKSNRVALMWAVPFSVALALFAGDLITFVLGDKWRLAQTLLVIVALSVGARQIAFNWLVFLRALNHTRPIFTGAALNLIVFLGVAIPGMHAWGLEGYGLAFAISTLVQILVRIFYMREIFEGFRAVPHMLRAFAPVVPAVFAVLAFRALAGSGDRPLWRACVELALYVAITIAATFVLERRLVREIGGYLRTRGGTAGAATPQPQ